MQKGFSQSAFDSELDVAGYPKTGILPARHQAAPEGHGESAGSSESEQKPLGPYAPHFSNESK